VLGRALEGLVVLCTALGFFLLMALLRLIPLRPVAIVVAVAAAFFCYLYGRYGRPLVSPNEDSTP
jgi:hypothetical protein